MQNKHTHYYSNETFVHSHPFDKSKGTPSKNHNHSKAEILFYHLVGIEFYSHSEEQFFVTEAGSSPDFFPAIKESLPPTDWLYHPNTRDLPALAS